MQMPTLQRRGHLRIRHPDATLLLRLSSAFLVVRPDGIARFNRRLINTELSVMSYANTGDYCEPQAYDVVALMALYKSR